MLRRKGRDLLSAGIACILLYAGARFYVALNMYVVETAASTKETNPRQGFSVYTTNCKIPEFDAWDSSILDFVMRRPTAPCNSTWGNDDLTYARGNILYIDKDAQRTRGGPVKYCTYKEVLRAGEGRTDDEYDYSTEVVQFNESASVDKDFIKVTCYDGNDERLPYSNFYSFVHLRESIERRCSDAFRPWKDTLGRENVNVLLVGLDSVSKYNFARQFPLTRHFLLENLGAFEMKGYTKVADNTFVNLMPFFTGKFAEETGWSELKKESFDAYPLSWRKYSERGYRTLFAEDAPEIAIWNYMKEGFRRKPADYYYRPLALAMERDGMATRMWNNDHDCFGSRFETEIILDYVTDFVRKFHDRPHFAFTFITRATHSDINKQTDSSHLHFLSGLHRGNLLNNTLVLYFSDHGMRYGPIVTTYMGKVEERMPAMFLSLPEWFLKKYPSVANNLKLNQNRLSSPFDIHATMEDILDFSAADRTVADKAARGISLLREIPEPRTCEQAGILAHWCTCQEQRSISAADPSVRRAAESLVFFINDVLSPHASQCSELRLASIVNAMVARGNDDVLKFKGSLNDVVGRQVFFGERATGTIETYLITVKTTPGEGLFSGTVQYEESNGKFVVKGEVSRINSYGTQSRCVEQHSVKKLCYCKEE